MITINIKLNVADSRRKTLYDMSKEYIRSVNQIVNDYVTADKNLKYSSKDGIADLPSGVRCQEFSI